MGHKNVDRHNKICLAEKTNEPRFENIGDFVQRKLQQNW
jgi:hypothetical protein